MTITKNTVGLLANTTSQTILLYAPLQYAANAATPPGHQHQSRYSHEEKKILDLKSYPNTCNTIQSILSVAYSSKRHIDMSCSVGNDNQINFFPYQYHTSGTHCRWWHQITEDWQKRNKQPKHKNGKGRKNGPKPKN